MAFLKVLAMVLAAALAVTARADAFRTATVPASFGWLWHVDVSGLKVSETGKKLLADPKMAAATPVAGFAARFGLDPLRDVRGLTVYTVSTGRQDAVAVIHAEPAAAVRLGKGAAGDPGKPYAGHAIRARGSGGEPVYYALTPDNRMVAALTEAHVKLGLDVLAGRKPPLAPSAVPALADRGNGAGAALVLAGATFGAEVSGLFPQLSLLRGANSLCLVLSEKEGQVEGGLSVAARDGAEAERLQNTLQGLLEVGRAMGSPPAAQMLRGIAVTRDGAFARASGKWNAQEVLRVLEARGDSVL